MLKCTGFEFQKAGVPQDFRLYSNSSQIHNSNDLYTQVCWERISGKNLATSHLNSIKIWDIRNPNSPQHYINAHPSKIYALDFSPVKENQLVSSAADNTIKMWNVSKPQKPVNILKVRDGSPVWKVKYTVCRRIILFIIQNTSIQEYNGRPQYQQALFN